MYICECVGASERPRERRCVGLVVTECVTVCWPVCVPPVNASGTVTGYALKHTNLKRFLAANDWDLGAGEVRTFRVCVLVHLCLPVCVLTTWACLTRKYVCACAAIVFCVSGVL